MARLDKYGRVLFVGTIDINNTISFKDNVPYISGNNITFRNIAVDTEDQSQVSVGRENPNIEVLASLGAYDETVKQSFELMIVNMFEMMGTQEYKDAILAQMETELV